MANIFSIQMWRLLVLGRSMYTSIYLCSVTKLLFGISGGLSIGKTVTADLTIDPAIKAELLRCWTCNQTEHCRDMYDLTGVTTETCRLDQAFCAIIKYQAVTSDVTYARGCQKDCRPDCRRITERIQCYSCCSNSLCNSETPSASAKQRPPAVQLLIGDTLLLFYFIKLYLVQ